MKSKGGHPHHAPFSALRMVGFGWDGLVSVAAIAAAVMIPLRLALAPDRSPLSGLWDTILTGIFCIDFVVRRFPSHRSHRHSQKAALPSTRPYTAICWIIVDAAGAIPWARLCGIPALDMVRLIKLVRLGGLLRMRRSGNVLRNTVQRLATFSIWLAISVHGLSCGWLVLRPSSPTTDSADAYLEATYWCVTTLTAVGYGDITPTTQAQTLYAMLVMILGVGVYGYVIGNVANLLSKLDMVKATYESNMDRLGGFLGYRQVPPDLQRRIFDYYAYLWDKRMGYDESTVLSDLPPSLRGELSLLLKRDLIAKVPFMRDASQDLICDLCPRLRPVVFTPGDIIVRAGDSGRNMYFIGHGRVEIIADDGKTMLKTLGEGDFFGEVALLHSQPRNATVRAVDYCDLYVLDKESFDQVIARYADFAAHIQDTADGR